MLRSIVITALTLLVAAGCSSATQDELRGTAPEGSPATVPWDERDLDGDLVELRASECSGHRCPLGTATLSDTVAVSAGAPAEPLGEVQVVITEATLLMGCGPSDGREPISFDDLARSRSTEVIGEMPTAVWLADPADEDPSTPGRALQIVSGSCG